MHHDKCILHRFPVVAWAPGEPLKAALAVEADGGEIGGPHLEQNPLSLPGAGLGQQDRKQRRAYPTAAEGGKYSHILQFPLRPAALSNQKPDRGA